MGRGAELVEVRRLLTAARLVTLTGVGGTGKTRLALRVAAQVRRAFRDGVWFVDLARLRSSPESPGDGQAAEVLADLVLADLVLADRVGAVPVAPRGGGSPMRHLIECLAGRQMLLVLDNCEHLVPSCAVLIDAVLRACPAVRVLATSRESLTTAGEMLYPVPPLPTPAPGRRLSIVDLGRCEAVALFAARARAAVPGWVLTDGNSGAVAEVCRRLDGLPLAIELVAARVRALTAEQMPERLGFALLSGGSPSAPARQQTLRACVEWSLDLCSEPERLLWARLSVFAGGFELDAVEGICADEALPEASMLDVVAGLVDKSILVRDHVEDSRSEASRFRMLETVREFGEGRLREAGEYDALHRRHRDWYQRLARRASAEWLGERQGHWKARLTAEHPNLRGAIEYALSRPGQTEAALQLALTVPLSYWYDRGLFGEVRSLLDRLLARTGAASALRARALLFAAQVAVTQGDSEAAMRLLERGEDLARQLGGRVELAYAGFVRGFLPLYQGDLPAAIEAFARMDAMSTAASGLAWELRLGRLVALGLAAGLAGDHVLADACHDEILAVAEPLGGHRSSALAGRALSAWQRGDVQEAERFSEASLAAIQALGSTDLYGVVRCVETMAWVTSGQHQHRRAATLLGAADGLRAGIGAPIAAFGHVIAQHENCERQVRAALGEAAFTAAFGQGHALSCDDAIAYALGSERAAAAPPAADPAPLTRREHEVADLIAAGRSNREIAGILVISQRTVDSHVEHILAKLDVAGRAQVAAWHAGRRPGAPQA